MRAGAGQLTRTVWTSARRWTPPLLLAVLSAGALAPLLTPGAGLATAGVGAVAAIGGNVLTDVVKAGVSRLMGNGGKPSAEDVQAELVRGIQETLEAGGEHAKQLRGDIARLMREYELVGAAIEAAVQTGDRDLQAALAASLAGLSEQFAEFAFVLSDVGANLRSIREGVDHNRAELQLAVGLQYRQATDTRLLLDQVSLIERRTRPGGASGGNVPRWEARSPYQGLAPYYEADAEVFAGREVATAELVSTLSQRLTGPGPLVVTGASGAGKSSLLRAGLIPAIGRGDLSEAARQWPRHVIDLPPRSPMSRLAMLLAGMAGLDAPGVLGALAGEPRHAPLLVRQALEEDARRRALPANVATRSRLVLVVDQFEEIFAVDDEEAAAERVAFIEALDAMATIPDGPDDAPAALVLIAVRGDYIDRCARHPQLATALRDGPFVLGPMTETELRIAISRPADSAALEIEPGLVDTILEELRSPAGGYDPGALPLLSQAMLTVWEHREDDRLTSRGYALTGGVTRAVATSAETAYDSLGPRRRDLARQLFQQLTMVSHDGKLTRRTVARTDLDAACSEEDRAGLDEVLELFARRRLIVVDTASAQIAHDTLLQNWPRLRDWLDTDLTGHALRSQLVDDADDWDRNGRAASYLYRGERLAAILHAERRRQADPLGRPPPTGTPEAFLDASMRAENRGRRQRRLALTTLSALLAAAVVLAGVAFVQGRTAREQRQAAQEQQRVATARLLISKAEAARGTDPRLALQLGISAESVHSDPQTRASLVSTLTTTQYAGTLTGYEDTVQSVTFSPNGRILATASRITTTKPLPTCGGVDGTGCDSAGSACPAGETPCPTPTPEPTTSTSVNGAIILWDMSAPARPSRLGTPLVIDNTYAALIAFSPDGRLLATNGDGGRAVTLWDVSDPAKPLRLGSSADGTSSDIRSVAFSPDGRTLATGRDNYQVDLWDVSDPSRITRRAAALTGQTKMVDSVAFSPDGRTLAAGSDESVMFWRVTDPSRPTRLGSPLTARSPVAFSSDGHLLSTHLKDPQSKNQNAFVLWDLTRATPTRIGTPMSGNNSSMAFSPTAKTAVTAGAEGSAVLWDLSDPARPVRSGSPLTGHTDSIQSVTVSPDGRTLITGSQDRTAILWNLTDVGRPAQRGSTLTGADSLAFRPDHRTLASGSANGTVSLWDLTDAVRPVKFDATLPGAATELSPDGRSLAVLGSDGAVTLWDVSNPAHPIKRGPPLPGSGTPALFSPDGRMLITGDEKASMLWDLSDPARPVQREKDLPAVIVLVAAFRPDSRTLAISNIYDFDGEVTLWDVSDPARPAAQPVPILAGDATNVTSASFSPDGRILITGRADGTMVLWDVSHQGQYVRIGQPLIGPSDPNGNIASLSSRVSVVALTFSADGRTLATTNVAGSLTLWDLTDDSAPHKVSPPMALPDKYAFDLKFAPDGKALATITLENKVALWDLSGINDLLANAVKRACSITGQGLDRTEWTRYISGLPYEQTCGR
jgi:WD40 repeat protein